MTNKIRMPKARLLPSGNWRCEVCIDGNRYSFVSESKEEAEKLALLKKLQGSADQGKKESMLKNITVFEAIDAYLNDTNNVLSPSTIKSYRSMQEYRFASVMDRPITSKINWQSVVNDEATCLVQKKVKTKDPDHPYKMVTTNKRLSPKTIKNAWGLIQTVYGYYGIPLNDVRLPKPVKTEHLFLEPDQIKVFLKAIEGHRFELTYLLALHGLRRSELIAVSRSDINVRKEDRYYIRVAGSMVYDETGSLVEKDSNKTLDSTRNVPVMIPRLITVLDEFQGDKLCTAKPGSYLNPLNTVCRQNNLPEVGLHGLRHTFASLCYYLKIPELVTMKWGGWSDPTVVREIYTHLSRKAEQDSLEKMDEFYATFE